MITKPVKFEEAVSFILNKDAVPSDEWDQENWNGEREDVSLRAFWSSRVENARFLDRAQAFIFDTLAEVTEEVTGPDGVTRTALRGGDRGTFVRRMREFMISEGIVSGEEEFSEVNQRDLRDIRSEARLRLIFDTNIRQAFGYGQWKQGQHPAILRRFPAQRFVRDREVSVERARHTEGEGEVRLKSDEAYWAGFQNDPEIGGFGVPWAPFGFNSGMGLRDVNREDALELGLDVREIQPDQSKNFNTAFSTSVKNLDPALKQKLIDELRSFEAPDAGEAGRQAALRVREQQGKIILEQDARLGDDSNIDERPEEQSEIGDLSGETAAENFIRLLLRESDGENSETRPQLPEERIRKDRERIKSLASSESSVLQDRLTPGPFPETGEFVVEVRDGRFWKQTKNGIYGFHPFADAPDLQNLRDLRITITPSSLEEFIQRIDLQNRLFGDSIRIEGVTQNGDIVISQPAIVGAEATREEISAALTASGWQKVPEEKTSLQGILTDSAWFHPEEEVVIVDARPANVLRGEDGAIYPIDLMLAPVDSLIRRAIGL